MSISHFDHPGFFYHLSHLRCSLEKTHLTSGGSLNPARVLGPAAVFGCGANVTWLYVGGQCLASICAMAVFGLVSHLGPYHPRTSTKTFELMTNEAGFVAWREERPFGRGVLRLKGDDGLDMSRKLAVAGVCLALARRVGAQDLSAVT